MKVNRRGMFGIGAGAVVAGPSAVTEAVKSVAYAGQEANMKTSPCIYGGTAYDLVQEKTDGMSDWVAQLNRLAKGAFSPEDLEEIEGMCHVSRLEGNVDALKSLSHAGRLHIYERRRIVNAKSQRMEHAKKTLLRMGKKALFG